MLTPDTRMSDEVKVASPDEIRARTRKRKRDAKKGGKGGSVRNNLNGPDKDILSADVAEKRRTALGLRKQKMTYADIASAMGLSTAMVAWRYVQDALADIPMEVAAEVKQLEIEDCRADLFRINQRLAEEAKGKKLTVRAMVAALGAKVKLREQLARYLGLYAPVRQEVTGKDGAPLLTLSMADIQGMTDDQLERHISAANRGSGSSGSGAGSAATASRATRQPH
jgi:predicted transcriptional regulator